MSGPYAPGFEIVVPGEPHGQGRPKATSIGGKARVYTPTKTRSHAVYVQGHWQQAGSPRLDPSRPYGIMLVSLRERPAGHLNSKGHLNKKGLATPYPTSKPDTDNEIKQYLDALCAVGAMPDDRLCAYIVAEKCWTEADGHARVVFRTWSL